MHLCRLSARLCVALCLSLIAVSAFAQFQTGNIYGKVVAKDGSALPGVTVTLTGVGAPQTIITDSQGNFHFLNRSRGKIEEVKVTLRIGNDGLRRADTGQRYRDSGQRGAVFRHHFAVDVSCLKLCKRADGNQRKAQGDAESRAQSTQMHSGVLLSKKRCVVGMPELRLRLIVASL